MYCNFDSLKINCFYVILLNLLIHYPSLRELFQVALDIRRVLDVIHVADFEHVEQAGIVLVLLLAEIVHQRGDELQKLIQQKLN